MMHINRKVGIRKPVSENPRCRARVAESAPDSGWVPTNLSKTDRFLLPLLGVLRPRWPAMAASITFGLALSGTTLAPPLLIRGLIQRLTEPGRSSGLLGIVLSLVVVYLGRGICRYAYGRFSHIVAYQTLDELMVRVYRHIQR